MLGSDGEAISRRRCSLARGARRTSDLYDIAESVLTGTGVCVPRLSVLGSVRSPGCIRSDRGRQSGSASFSGEIDITRRVREFSFAARFSGKIDVTRPGATRDLEADSGFTAELSGKLWRRVTCAQIQFPR